jgi:hypothetical protein
MTKAEPIESSPIVEEARSKFTKLSQVAKNGESVVKIIDKTARDR